MTCPCSYWYYRPPVDTWCQLQKAMQNYALPSQSWHGLFSFSCPSVLIILVAGKTRWDRGWGVPQKDRWFNMESEPQVDRRWFWVGLVVTCYKAVQNLCLSLMGNLQNGSFTMPKAWGIHFGENLEQTQVKFNWQTDSGSFSILLIPTSRNLEHWTPIRSGVAIMWLPFSCSLAIQPATLPRDFNSKTRSPVDRNLCPNPLWTRLRNLGVIGNSSQYAHHSYRMLLDVRHILFSKCHWPS